MRGRRNYALTTAAATRVLEKVQIMLHQTNFFECPCRPTRIMSSSFSSIHVPSVAHHHGHHNDSIHSNRDDDNFLQERNRTKSMDDTACTSSSAASPPSTTCCTTANTRIDTHSNNNIKPMHLQNNHCTDTRTNHQTKMNNVKLKNHTVHACNCLKSSHEILHPFDTKPMQIIERHQSWQRIENRNGSSSSSSSGGGLNVSKNTKPGIIHNNNNHSTDLSQIEPNKNERTHTCRNYYIENNIPFPPPLPEPKYSFYRRVLPQSLIQLSSPQGKTLFKESLSNQTAESFFPLSEQFLNQSDPAYCGITSLVMVLNAIGIDPNIRWKGGWRWYGSEDMILNGCCIDSERVQRAGISMEEYQSLGRCQGLKVHLKRPVVSMLKNEDIDDGSSSSFDIDDNGVVYHIGVKQQNDENEKGFTIDEFRNDIKAMTQNPPIYEQTLNNDDNNNNNNHNQQEKVNGGFMVVSFARQILGQTGDGHFSPVAAYHESTDRCLILDVARFKYSPFWVSITDLYEAMKPVDKTTNKSRGWFMNHPPDIACTSTNNNEGTGKKSNKTNNVVVGVGYRGSKTVDEMKRPASTVPLFESGTDTESCPVAKIKKKYCSVEKS